MSTRVMTGVADYTGHETGTLRIDAMVSRHPSPRYSATCERCGAKQTVAQRDLKTGAATCRASGCSPDREAIRQTVEDTPRRFAQREARLKQDRIDAIAREVKDKADKIARLQRDRLLTGVDVDFPYDPEAREMRMTAQQADAFNRASAAQFIREHPDYLPSEGNLKIIEGYLQRNGMDALVSARQLHLVYERLDAYRVLERRPEPTPAPVVNLSIERPPEPPKRPEPQIGFDLKTGQEREFSAFEVSRMSADEYKKTFRLWGDKMPIFPTHAAF